MYLVQPPMDIHWVRLQSKDRRTTVVQRSDRKLGDLVTYDYKVY